MIKPEARKRDLAELKSCGAENHLALAGWSRCVRRHEGDTDGNRTTNRKKQQNGGGGKEQVLSSSSSGLDGSL